MHELGIVFNIIRQVKEVAEGNNVSEVLEVIMDIGEVSTIISDYLIDCYKWAIKKEPLLEDSKLVCNIIKADTLCNNCNKHYETVKYGKVCPYCASENTYLFNGNQVEIREIKVKQI